METPIKILIVEDDEDFVYLIRKLLRKQKRILEGGIEVCVDKNKAVRQACICKPDIVLMDLHLGRSSMDGILISREIRILTDAKILILTAIDTPDIVMKAAKKAFASGYIFKNQLSLLVENIFAIADGYTAEEYLLASSALNCLSEAEMAVFQRMMGKEIELRSSPKTIANQKTKIFEKLGLENQKELIHVFRLFKSCEEGKHKDQN